jgi:catechol 2,3-dioxygenase-like lactoylglutathione lyase family enzyme
MRTSRIATVRMFVRDLDRSRLVYEKLLSPLAVEITYADQRLVVFGGRFQLYESSEPTENAEVAFSAPSPETVREFYRAGVRAGLRSIEAPRARGDRFSAAVEDLDANIIGAVYRVSGKR